MDAPPVTPARAAGSMAQGNGKRVKQAATMVKPTKGVDEAFDLWLNRGLHQLYDAVAQEPLPPELLDLIEEDREKQEEKGDQ